MSGLGRPLGLANEDVAARYAVSEAARIPWDRAAGGGDAVGAVFDVLWLGETGPSRVAWRFWRRDAAATDRFRGVKALLEENADATRSLDSETRGVPVATPYAHVAVLTSVEVPLAQDFEARLARAIRDEFGHLLDPKADVRVRFFRPRAMAAGDRDVSRVVFGAGVHFGRPHSEIGPDAPRLRIWDPRRGSDGRLREREPLLPDGAVAGFHPTQDGLAVGVDPSRCAALASCEALKDKGTVFYFGRRPGGRDCTFHWSAPTGVDYIAAPVNSEGVADGGRPDAIGIDFGKTYAVLRRPGTKPPSETTEYAADVDGGELFRFRLDLDAGPTDSRGPALAIRGLRLPDPAARPSELSRIWVDFDAQGRLVRNGLTPRRYSLVIEDDDVVGVFDHDPEALDFRSECRLTDDGWRFDVGELKVGVSRTGPEAAVREIAVFAQDGGDFGRAALQVGQQARYVLDLEAESADEQIGYAWLDAAGVAMTQAPAMVRGAASAHGVVVVGGSRGAERASDARSRPETLRAVADRLDFAPRRREILIHRSGPSAPLMMQADAPGPNGFEPIGPGETIRLGPLNLGLVEHAFGRG